MLFLTATVVVFPERSIANTINCSPSIDFTHLALKGVPFYFQGVLNACAELKQRITPIQLVMGNPTWVELIQKCYSVGVDLSSKQL